MNLSEAAKTGRPFRRPSDPMIWYWLDGKDMMHCCGHPRAGAETFKIAIDAEMVVANDWEPDPLRLDVNADDIMRAARQLDDIASKRRLSAAEFGKMICKELGLLEE